MSRADKAVIFDLDGTLLDTIKDLTRAVNFALEKFGYPLRTAAEVRSFIGNGALVLMSRASGEPADSPRCAELRRAFGESYRENLCVDTVPYEGMTGLVASLAASGVATAVVSNKDDECVKRLIDRFFGDNIAYARGTRSQAERKPCPDLVFEVLKKLGRTPENALLVGDGRSDIGVAKNAGVRVAPVAYGYTDPEVLYGLSGKKPAADSSELAEIIGAFLSE